MLAKHKTNHIKPQQSNTDQRKQHRKYSKYLQLPCKRNMSSGRKKDKYQAWYTKQRWQDIKNNKDKSYIGLTDNTFKTWYHGHTNSFRNVQDIQKCTGMPQPWAVTSGCWNITKIKLFLKQRIIDRGRVYQPWGENCGLCDSEKF